MINAEDLRIGDIVQTNKDCTFLKGTLCIVTDIHPDRQYDGKTKRIVRCILPDGSPTFTITPLVKHNLQERRNAKRRKR